ncbi:MAG: glycosyltransferase family 4 protein [Pedobacter sp.]|uniref:glycosyltransferase n=1 Tax=Pedobacter sp. TaxID=1411316 RepID=UPI00339914E9
MNNKRLLIIGLVWPEPGSSAAGTRIIQLAELFIAGSYEVFFASAAIKGEFSYPLQQIGVKEKEIVLNDKSFNTFLKELSPDTVLFDRFVMEEQYGWRVQQECPHAMRILDTEDLHFLRHARQEVLKTGQPLNLFSDTAKREVASVLRCDLSLIISEVEMDILREQFHIDRSLLCYLPFLEEKLTEEIVGKWKAFEEREGFVFIGNFLHEPNWNTLQVLKTKIWPELRKRLPTSILHIYGAYPSQKVMQLNNVKENFRVHGRAADARQTIAAHKVLLAPIQFGAGVKGKFIDAMQGGTPAVTTSAGAEAMRGNLEWNGAIADDQEAFIDQAVSLYNDKNRWSAAQQNGIRIINERYEKSKFATAFLDVICSLTVNLQAHRRQNFIGQILLYHTVNSSKYMSLWIEEKNKKK